MKKSSFLLSALLVPSLILQGQTCTSGGGGTPVLPTSVTGLQTYNADGSYSFVVSSVTLAPGTSSSAFTASKTPYGVWCTAPDALVPGGATGSANGISAVYTPIGYATYSVSTAGGGFGTAGNVYDVAASTAASSAVFDIPLTVKEEWNAVNWILNNAASVSPKPTATDEEFAIRQLLYPQNASGIVWVSTSGTGTYLTSASAALYTAALANTGFDPTSAPIVAVLMIPTGSGSSYQTFIVPVPTVPCTSTGSATITKTANVKCANAYQIVTFTYVVKNTGTTTLSNLVVVDDNGTPNYSEDDVTVGTLATLAAGSSHTFTSTAYLPISLFYQSGGEASFDTLIPQNLPATATAGQSLLLTYLIDSDVSDNTYGTGASAGWAGNGGHTFAEELGNYAEFGFYDAKGNLMSDFNADYVSQVGAVYSGMTYPSTYGSALPTILVGSKTTNSYISYTTSTLVDNLNSGVPGFATDTVNSPTGTANWQTIAGYKVIVDDRLFGMYGIGGAAVKKNYLTATETSFGGKCGYAKPASYCPTLVTSQVTSSAYLVATVCGCTTVVHAKACLTLTLNGSTQPTCNSAPSHKCQNPTCGCSCANCKAGHCNQCSDYGCPDSVCQKHSCPHGQVKCVVSGVRTTYCW